MSPIMLGYANDMAGGVGVAVVFLLLGLLIIASMWKIFKKAGQPGWAILIPIYNFIILLKVVNKPVWWIILFIIPFVNVIISIIIAHRLSLSFGKDVGFTIGLIILPIIFYPVLAFSDAQYKKLPE